MQKSDQNLKLDEGSQMEVQPEHRRTQDHVRGQRHPKVWKKHRGLQDEASRPAQGHERAQPSPPRRFHRPLKPKRIKAERSTDSRRQYHHPHGMGNISRTDIFRAHATRGCSCLPSQRRSRICHARKHLPPLFFLLKKFFISKFLKKMLQYNL